MAQIHRAEDQMRFSLVSQEKADGETYTPKMLSDFVAKNIVCALEPMNSVRPIRVLDPAVGHGQLILSLLHELSHHQPSVPVEVYCFDLNKDALSVAESNIHRQYPSTPAHFFEDDFIRHVLDNYGATDDLLSWAKEPHHYDLVIANPPYVRTQIMGAERAQEISTRFGLAGRIDLYYAFVLAISQVLGPKGVAGIIVSNRFMTTRSGASLRRAIAERFKLKHIWDFGDTKLFSAAVLPSVLLVESVSAAHVERPKFTSIYETSHPESHYADNPIEALKKDGVVKITDGRTFNVQHGTLDDEYLHGEIWRLHTDTVGDWLQVVQQHSWGTFSHIGKIRVGVKTCADKVFISHSWDKMPAAVRPELLRPLTTHHAANRFRAIAADKGQTCIIYPHEVSAGQRRAVDISQYPKTERYLMKHRECLEQRKYVIEAGREWYEIWVPQDPDAWELPKLVFRDIAEKPAFWMDLDGSVVNGDCYWIAGYDSVKTDLLWLACAVGNSSFIEQFYDYRFNNKLYAGRRRFITQYVEKFPLPNPQSDLARAISAKAKQIYGTIPFRDTDEMQKELDNMVWKAFGLSVEKTAW